MVMAAVVGLAMGLVATLFRWMVIQSHFFFQGDGERDSIISRIGPDWSEKTVQIILPGLGGLIVGLLIYKILKLRGGHGVPGVMKAVATGQVNLSPSMAIKSASSPITITSGGSAGPEGPIVEIGAVIGSTLGRWSGIKRDQIGTLIGCGTAGGIAAVFNAPMGAVVFTLELIMRDLHVRKFAPIVIAAVLASVTSGALLPNDPVFIALGANTLDTIHPNLVMVALFVLLGIVCGGIGMLLVAALYRAADLFQALPVPMWTKPAIGGLLVGVLGVFAPAVLGKGYESLNTLVLGVGRLNPEIVYNFAFMALLLCILKIVATSLTLGSGGTGGSFAPAMMAGAFIGTCVGALSDHLLPGFSPDFRIFVMVGMAGVVSSAIGTPLAALLIIYEVAGGEYRLVLPLMITVAMSSLVSAMFRKGSVYTLSLLRDGFDVEEAARRRDPLEDITVGDIMARKWVTIPPGEPLSRILELLAETDVEAFVVGEADGRLHGVICASDLRSVVNLGEMGVMAIIAGDIANAAPPLLQPNTPASKALEIFSSTDVEGIPVVEDEQSRLMKGMVYRGDLLRAYRKASTQEE